MKDSHSAQSSMRGYTEGLGETFLKYIEESKRWQADLINEIHRDQSSATERGISAAVSHPHATGREKRLEQKLIDLLYFPETSDRENRIVVAHKKTFRWIYSDPDSGGTPWPSFTKWLQSGSGLYWITGKAGSGKSTLMKFIYNNDLTFDNLRAWRLTIPLATGVFFFWNSGHGMQMSQLGMLQSILCQLVTKFPDLIPRLFPERWEAYNLFSNDPQDLTKEELLRAFRLLADE
ncbi:uncharacterized protein K444DRAFT_663675, partial [Hyaloscypha bicolor E]